MKRRAGVVALAALAVLLLLDSALWWLAVAALGRGVDTWAAQQRQAGLDVIVGPTAATGWPFSAGINLPSLRLGPAGLPGGARLELAATLRLSPLRPRIGQLAIARVMAIHPRGALTASASSWTVDIPRATAAPVVSDALGLQIAWGGWSIVVGRLHGSLQLVADTLRLAAQLDDIDLTAAGIAMPPPFGPSVGAAALDVTLSRLPKRGMAAGTSPSTWTQAWHDQGGHWQVAEARLRDGPLDAVGQGAGELDALLRPTGSASVAVRGLPALLDALAVAGLVAPRAGQAASGALSLLGGADQRVDLPVTASDGVLSVAGFPLARLAAVP